MSDNNTLDDLILTDPEPEGGKSKGLLALLALVILLIIVGAILAKMIFSSPDDDIKKDSSSDVKKEVNVSQNTIDSSSKKDNTTLPEDGDLAPLDDASLPANVDTVSIDDKADETSKQEKKSENSDSAMTITKPEVSNEAKNQEPKRVTKKEEPKPKPKLVDRKVEHKPKPKTRHLIGGTGNVYIQVGSFAKGPAESFINKIRRAGFKYRIKEVNGFRRVLVGPFRSQEEASRYLGRVKSQISSSAFIKK